MSLTCLMRGMSLMGTNVICLLKLLSQRAFDSSTTSWRLILIATSSTTATVFSTAGIEYFVVN